MTLEKGWINRQFARLERDALNWPAWMREEGEHRHTPLPESCSAADEAGQDSAALQGNGQHQPANAHPKGSSDEREANRE